MLISWSLHPGRVLLLLGWVYDHLLMLYHMHETCIYFHCRAWAWIDFVHARFERI